MNPNDNIINTRDIIKFVEEYKEQLEDMCSILATEIENEDWDEAATSVRSMLAFLDEDDKKCWLDFYKKYQNEITDYDEGAQLINDDYFTKYAEELAYEVSEIPSAWPSNCINWDAAAQALQQDYMEVELGGNIFWVRT